MRTRLKYKKKALENGDVDITSLLDIIVILLVFLLQNLSSSGKIFKVLSDITVPSSFSKKGEMIGPTIQVGKDKIWGNEQIIFETKGPLQEHFNERPSIAPLFQWLSTIKQTDIEILAMQQGDAPKIQSTRLAPQSIVNIVLDQKMSYEFTKKILRTCAEAGFIHYNFVVKNKN